MHRDEVKPGALIRFVKGRHGSEVHARIGYVTPTKVQLLPSHHTRRRALRKPVLVPINYVIHNAVTSRPHEGRRDAAKRFPAGR